MLRFLTACHHGRRIHVVADAAYHGKALRDLPATCTFTTRLPASAGRWSIEVTFAEARDLLGVGQARNRTQAAVERTVPFGLYCYTITVVWYALHGHHPADAAERREHAPWYTTKAEPSVSDMVAKLRRVIIAARFLPTRPGRPTDQEIRAVQQACPTCQNGESRATLPAPSNAVSPQLSMGKRASAPAKIVDILFGLHNDQQRKSLHDGGEAMKARRIAAAGATLVAATVMTLSIPGQAFAATYSLDGQNPVSAGCAADATTIESDNVFTNDITGDHADIDLRYSVHCHAAWARVRTTMTGYSTYAWIERESDGKSYHCNSLTWSSSLGEYSCYTAVVYDLSPLRSRAEGNVNIGGTNFQGFTNYY